MGSPCPTRQPPMGPRVITFAQCDVTPAVHLGDVSVDIWTSVDGWLVWMVELDSGGCV